MAKELCIVVAEDDMDSGMTHPRDYAMELNRVPTRSAEEYDSLGNCTDKDCATTGLVRRQPL